MFTVRALAPEEFPRAVEIDVVETGSIIYRQGRCWAPAMGTAWSAKICVSRSPEPGQPPEEVTPLRISAHQREERFSMKKEKGDVRCSS